MEIKSTKNPEYKSQKKSIYKHMYQILAKMEIVTISLQKEKSGMHDRLV